MDEIPILDNPIAWVQVRLSLPLVTLVVLGAYILVIISLILLSVDLSNNARDTAQAWAYGLLGLQAAGLVIFGSVKVGVAIRRDFSSRMIESHRLMPISPSRAIAGYLLGTSIQPMAFALANVVIGLALASMTPIGPLRWLFANLLVIYFAYFVWMLVILLTFVSRYLLILLALPVVGPFCGAFYLLVLLPALFLVVAPLTGGAVLNLASPSYHTSPYVIGSVLVDAWFGAIWFWGAARKYRQPDQMAIPPPLALATLLGWTMISIIGLQHWDQIRPSILSAAGFAGSDLMVQWVASMTVTLLVAAMPICNAARASAEWERKMRAQVGKVRRPLAPELYVIVVTVICLCLLSAGPQGWDISPYTLLASAAVIAFYLLALLYLMRTLYRVSLIRGNVLAGLWIFLTWLGPLALDLVRFTAFGFEGKTVSMLGMISPPATLWGIVSGQPGVWLGLCVQGAAAVAFCVLYYHPRKTRTVPLAIAPPVIGNAASPVA